MDVREKIGVLRAQATAAHSRLDKIETEIREDLKEINVTLKDLEKRILYIGFLVALISGASGQLIPYLLKVIGQ